MFFLIGIRETYLVQQETMKTRFISSYLFAPQPVTERRFSKK